MCFILYVHNYYRSNCGLGIVCLIADRHRTLEIKVLCRVQISRLFHSFIHFYAGFPEVLTEKEEECSQCTMYISVLFYFFFLVSVVLIRNNVII